MRVAVIGAGSIGSRHIRNLMAMDERHIHVFDADIARQTSLIAEGQVSVYGTLRDLYASQVDAVLICTPPDSHLRLAAEARLHGVKGIFIEKPLALSWVIGVGVMEDCVTMVGCNWRFAAGPLAVKHWLDKGLAGDVLSARIAMGYHLPGVRAGYKTCYAATTGAILDVGSHAVDLALWLFGPAKLKAAVVKSAMGIGLKCDGLAELMLEHDTGAISSVHVDFVGAQRLTEIAVRGGGADYRMVSEADPAPCMYKSEIAHFLECVRENKQTCNSMSQAVATLSLLLEAKACA